MEHSHFLILLYTCKDQPISLSLAVFSLTLEFSLNRLKLPLLRSHYRRDVVAVGGATILSSGSCHTLILPLRFHLSYHLHFNQYHKHDILLTFNSLGLPLLEIIKNPLCFLFTFLLSCTITLLTLFKIQKYVLFPFSYCTRYELAIKESSLVFKLGF